MLALDSAGNVYVVGGVFGEMSGLRRYPPLNVAEGERNGRFTVKFDGISGGVSYAALLGDNRLYASPIIAVFPDGRRCATLLDGSLACLSPAGDAVTYKGRVTESLVGLTAAAALPDGTLVLAGNTVLPGAATPGAYQQAPADSVQDAFVTRLAVTSDPPVLTESFPSAVTVTPLYQWVGAVTVAGKRISGDMEVRWNGVPVLASYTWAVGGGSFTIVTSELGPQQPGVVEITVARRDFPEQVSNPLRITILAEPPQAGALTPVSVPAGSGDQVVSFQGSFFPGTRLLWDGVERQARFIPRVYLNPTSAPPSEVVLSFEASSENKPSDCNTRSVIVRK